MSFCLGSLREKFSATGLLLYVTTAAGERIRGYSHIHIITSNFREIRQKYLKELQPH